MKMEPNAIWALRAQIVRDVLESEKRSLFYHPDRVLVINENIKETSCYREFPISNTGWMSEKGMG